MFNILFVFHITAFFR